MDLGGTSPGHNLVTIARLSLAGPRELIVMIRPRGGDFTYTEAEIKAMRTSIDMAAGEGADGVVFGLICNGQIEVSNTRLLIEHAHKQGLKVTFHRAFDAVKNSRLALDSLISIGIDRILTAGVSWGSKKGAGSGIASLSRLLEQAQGRVEIVVGGGISHSNAPELVASLRRHGDFFSLHAHSSLLEDSIAGSIIKPTTNAQLVSRLVEAAH